MTTEITTDGREEAHEESALREAAITAKLDQVERRVEEQGRSMKRTQQGFAIFAGLALIIALVNLVAVAVKLDGKTTTTASSKQPSVATAPVVPAPAAATPAAAAAPAASHTIGVSLKEFTVAPTPTVGAAGKVTFNVHNAGNVPHEFVVLRTPKAAGSLLKGDKADEAGNVGETGDLAPGKSKSVSVTLKKGHYVLLCNLPGHYTAGQRTDFTVQ
jgi:uncharacterized cupredoxin-like copper-binding protein